MDEIVVNKKSLSTLGVITVTAFATTLGWWVVGKVAQRTGRIPTLKTEVKVVPKED